MAQPMAIPQGAASRRRAQVHTEPLDLGELASRSLEEQRRVGGRDPERTPEASPPGGTPLYSPGEPGQVHSFDDMAMARSKWMAERSPVQGGSLPRTSLLADSLVRSPERTTSSSYPPGRSLAGGGGGGGGGVARGGDWRSKFVAAATTANRKAEFLHGSECRETRELGAILDEAVLALERGIKPDLVEDGLGGTYFVKDRNGKSIGVFKPRDEEPLAANNPKAHVGDGVGEGLNQGVNVGEAALNEYAAFLLDQSTEGSLRAGVCPTALVRMAHSAFHKAGESKKAAFKEIKDKVGSFQLFAHHDMTAEDMGSSKFTPEHVHAIAVLDIRLCNTDRHPGNVLVRATGGTVTDLVPIDHGYALPGEVGSAEFEWLYWPAAKEPFSAAMREEILAIDVEGIDAMLRRRIPVLRSACLHTLAVCTTLLQRGVAAGLTAHDIGQLMVRPFCRRDEEQQPSALEELVGEAQLQGDAAEPMMKCFARLAEVKCKAVAAEAAAEGGGERGVR